MDELKVRNDKLQLENDKFISIVENMKDQFAWETNKIKTES